MEQLQQDYSQSLQSLPLKKGNFTQVPNEVIEFFMNRKNFEGTSREYAIIFFLIRELQGWDYQYKPIELSEFVNGTGMAKQNIIPTLKALVEKGLILKRKLTGFRTPLYGFNSEKIGRVIASQKPKQFCEKNGKIIDLMSFKVIKSMPLEIIESMTQKRQESARRAASQVAKDPQIHSNTLSERKTFDEKKTESETESKIDKKDWSSVRTALVEKYPGEEKKIDAIYRELQTTGKDDLGREIKCLPALMLSEYVKLRDARKSQYTSPSKKPEPEYTDEDHQRNLNAATQWMPQILNSLRAK